MAYEVEPGENTVTVEVEDIAGNQTTAQFTFIVEATYDSLAELSAIFVEQTGAKGSTGIIASLRKKLENAKAAFERGDNKAANEILQSYIDQVADLSGNKLEEEQADILIRWAQTMM